MTRPPAGEDAEATALVAAQDAAAQLLAAGCGTAAPPRESEELRPVSLADLFAGDPECAAAAGKGKGDKGRAGLARTHAFAGAGLDDELELRKLQVFVRIRPSVTAGAPRWDAENCIHATSKHSVAIAPPEGSQAYKAGDRGQTFAFTRVFDAGTPQDEYYAATAAPLVRDLLRNPRHNSAMMAYGITAAGKTYTIEGTQEAPGVMPRALLDLFRGLDAHVEPVVARASYYEVYNEQIYDLLDEAGAGPLGARAPLRLKEDTLGRVFVAGLSETEVGSAEQALAVLRRGSRQRQRGETALNYCSSRSHSIFTVTLYQQGLQGQDSLEGGEGEEAGAARGEERLGRISFVDLAGSERAQRTGNVGVRLKESVAINSSLMTLGRCLEALRWNQQHRGGGNLRVVPYRESKVTHLFRDALHGWGQVVLSVNVSPASRDYDETAHVLKYAALATQIGTLQQAEAPRRTIKAVSPAIKKQKRKAALPPEARRGQGQAKAAKKAKKAAPVAGEQQQQERQQEQQAAEALAADDDEQEQQALEAGSPVGQPASRSASPALLSAGGVAEYELHGEDEEEGGATPATPLDEEEAGAALQAQVQQLIGELQAAEERCVLLEAEVREEVAAEMAQLLRDMEESYRQRLQAEVATLDGRKAAEAGRRGRARGGKDAQADAGASAEQLAAAREEAARAAAEAEQLQQQVADLQAQAEQQQAAAAERAAELEAAAATAQQAAAQAQEQLASEQQRAAGLESELAAARQASCEAAAGLEERSQQCASLAAELEQAQEAAAQATAALAAEAERAAGLEAELGAARAAADSSQAAASQEYQAQLQEAVTQLEANKGMELEMAEEQGERLRKENLALQRRLGAALAALAAYGSPGAGPASLAARMAQAAPEGGGRGAGGTPHDVALARARQAAAADDLAAAAAAAAGGTAGASTAPRSRSRFASEAEVAAAPPTEQGAPLSAVPEEEQLPAGETAKPAQRGRGRQGKKVAFAGLEAAADEEPAAAVQPAEAQQQEQAAATAPPESRRARRMTRAGAAETTALPAIAEQQQQQQLEPEPQPTKGRGRRKTQAVVVPAAVAVVGQQQEQPAPGAAVAAVEQRMPTGRGRRKTQAAAAPAAAAPAEQPNQASAPEPAPAAEPTAAADASKSVAAEQAEAELAAKPRRRGRPAKANKENVAAQTAAAVPGTSLVAALAALRKNGSAACEAAAASTAPLRPQPAAEEPAPAAAADAAEGGAKGGGKRRKRLLPTAPMSHEMRAALGELEDAALQRPAKAAAGGAAKRTRRQTQFYKL